MKTKSLIIWAVLLIAVGALGLFASFAQAGGSVVGDSFSSAGQRIYYTGTDSTGRPIPRSVAGGGMMGFGMGAMACADCHGTDGRGGRLGMMFWDIDLPDIRYSALTSAHSENGTTTAGWTDTDIARAVRDGIEPDGQRIKAPMSRWTMTDAEIGEVIAYLKELSRQ